MSSSSIIFRKKRELITLGIIFVLILLFTVWLRGGLNSIFFDTDLARDLSEMSNIRRHHVVWLGPHLSAGFPSSPIYYYLFFPVLFISRWNANSLIIANILLALFALGVLGIISKKKWGYFSLIGIFVTGLIPFWQSVVIHPGNGYTYVIWLYFSLISLWFDLPIFISSLLLGLAIAHHPAAIFGLLLIFYEWWRNKHSFKNLGLIIVGLILPWIPIIVFEVITKFFLTRSLLTSLSQHSKFTLHFSVMNLQQIALDFGLGNILGSIMLLLIGFVSNGRTRMWFYLILFSLVFFLISPLFPPHYLLGIACIIAFTSLVVLSQRRWGQVTLIILFAYYIIQVMFFTKIPTPTRSISKINNVVEKLTKSGTFNKKNKIAVVAILSKDTSVPQGDDYRYFLRVRDYQVLDVIEYAQADMLIMFVEEPQFDWQTWSSWETDQFGSKKISYKTNIDGIKIIEFTK